MKLIDVSCPSCQAVMKVDKKNKEVHCEYCGHIFLIDDEVIKVVHMQTGDITEEQEYKNAETNLNKFKDYKKAYSLYSNLSNRYADDPVVWIGLLRCISKDFTNREYDCRYEDYWNRFTSLASKKEINEWQKDYDEYINSFSGYEKEALPQTKEMDYIYETMLGGWFGLHKFVKDEGGKGVLYLLTGGLFGIGWIIDIIIEVVSHPNRRQKVYNCLGIYAIIMGLIFFQFSIIGALLMIIAGVICFKRITMLIWKNPVSYSKFIKIGLFIVGFVISMMSIPDYVGTWYYCTETTCSSIVEVNVGSMNVNIEEGTDTKHYKYKVKETKKNFIITYDQFELTYHKKDGSICISSNSECSIVLTKNKEELNQIHDSYMETPVE